MPIQVQKVRIFIASPGDVQSEREQLSKVINELNQTVSILAPEKGIVLELVRWETPSTNRCLKDAVYRFARLLHAR
jgi:hypothetical protein